MSKIDISNLDLDQLADLREEISERIDALRAEAIAALKTEVERQAARLGSPLRLVNGTRRKRKSAEESEAAS